MPLRTIITLAILASFLLRTDACAALRVTRNDVCPGKSHYACPNPSKWILPDISLSPFQVGSDYHNDRKPEQRFTVVPVTARLFKKLDMVLLPSREVCISGEKSKNFILTESELLSELRIMIGIASGFLLVYQDQPMQKEVITSNDR